ncbi:glutathione S-transferase family protein [Puniceibacterium sp. IMCC21224]|uniref:glutathione S-transferase family protein n=1 Tax=Puniceibacterium sp. IMCC21224 TaxID=1618204 RepID=UPI00064DCBCE|nr:glutathione S-transferase family protein [Puniceibacterium sp. IMCC21224]KMK66823.1 glutathione S-transferase [Puniceibacterium sp. IMCC21224]
MNQPYRLHYAPDNASLIVRLALLELGQSFETVLVDRSAREQRSPAYRALNPVGRIPMIETPHGPVFETGAILLWLAETHNGLAPAADSPGRGAFLAWLFFLSNTVHAEMRMLFYPATYAGPHQSVQQGLRLRIQDNICGHLGLLDQAAGTGHSWFGAEQPTLLDIYLCPLLRWCALYPDGHTDWFRLSDTPALHAIATRFEARDTVRIASQAEGLGPSPFSAPQRAAPPEGSAT